MFATSLWALCASVLVVNAAEPTLGDRRLFFSGQERQAMARVEKGMRVTGPTSELSNGRRRADNPVRVESVASLSKVGAAGSSSDRKSAFIVNGFIEASGFLTLFVNGKPCNSLSLAIENPQEFHCDLLTDRSLQSLSLVRVDEYQFAIKKADGNVIFLDRRVGQTDE